MCMLKLVKAGFKLALRLLIFVHLLVSSHSNLCRKMWKKAAIVFTLAFMLDVQTFVNSALKMLV